MGVRAVGIGFIASARSLRIENSHINGIDQSITSFIRGDSCTALFEDGLCAGGAELCLQAVDAHVCRSQLELQLQKVCCTTLPRLARGKLVPLFA